MNVSQSKCDEIRSQHSSDAERCSRACWELYLKDHPSPTWQGVAYALYMRVHLKELEVVLKKYLKGERAIIMMLTNSFVIFIISRYCNASMVIKCQIAVILYRGVLRQ